MKKLLVLTLLAICAAVVLIASATPPQSPEAHPREPPCKGGLWNSLGFQPQVPGTTQPSRAPKGRPITKIGLLTCWN
jgi:hypothetical protein